jgi:hypothetical protein
MYMADILVSLEVWIDCFAAMASQNRRRHPETTEIYQHLSNEMFKLINISEESVLSYIGQQLIKVYINLLKPSGNQ